MFPCAANAIARGKSRPTSRRTYTYKEVTTAPYSQFLAGTVAQYRTENNTSALCGKPLFKNIYKFFTICLYHNCAAVALFILYGKNGQALIAA